MKNPRIKKLNDQRQSLWYDNMERGLLASGEMGRMIKEGITGVTSNPSIFEKAISESNDYDDALKSLWEAGLGVGEIYEALILDDIGEAADLFRPVFDRTGGNDGYVSLEPRPALAYDTRGTIAEIRHLYKALLKPNAMLKVPATKQGIAAVEALVGEGLNINITLMFSLAHYEAVADAYLTGLEHLEKDGGDLRQVFSVASFFVSRIDTKIDQKINELTADGHSNLGELKGKAGIASAKLAYRRFKEVFSGERFAALKAKGARLQKPLWGSTSTKNPDYRDVMYVEELIGTDTINTVPAVTLAAFKDHGRVSATLEQGVDEAKKVLKRLEEAGINMDEVPENLQEEGVRLFGEDLDKLLVSIDQKCHRLAA